MRAIGALVLAVVGVLGVSGLADLTQSRPDTVAQDSSTTVVAFDVGTRNYNGTDLDAARALWAVCAASVSGEANGPTADGGDGYAVTISPALGTTGSKKLLGCLEDGTLDRVQGHVRSVTSD